MNHALRSEHCWCCGDILAQAVLIPGLRALCSECSEVEAEILTNFALEKAAA